MNQLPKSRGAAARFGLACLVALALIATSCGGEATQSAVDASSSADSSQSTSADGAAATESATNNGNEGQASSGDTQPTTAGTASYCQLFRDVTNGNEADAFVGMIGVIENLGVHGPPDRAAEFEEFGIALRVADDIANGREPDISVLDASTQTRILRESDERLQTVFEVIGNDCPGSEAGIVLLGGEPVRQDTALAGPFSTVSHGHTDVSITGVTVSNIFARFWLEEDARPSDDGELFLIVEFEMFNNDTVQDAFGVLAFPELLIDGVKLDERARDVFDDLNGAAVEPQSSSRVILGFDLPPDLDGRSLTADRLALILDLRRAATLLEFSPDRQPPDPYPLSAAVDGPITFDHGDGNCKFPHTVTLDQVAIELDAPIDLDIGDSQNRVFAGDRWVHASGSIATEAGADCVDGTTDFNSFFAELAIDGGRQAKTFFSEGVINAGDTFAFDLLWRVPAEVDAAGSVVLEFGTRNDTATFTIDVPDIPPAPNE